MHSFFVFVSIFLCDTKFDKRVIMCYNYSMFFGVIKMKNIYFAVICCVFCCNNSWSAESTIEASHINAEDSTKAKLTRDRNIIYELCAKHKEKALDAYNKVHSDKEFQKTIVAERLLLDKVALEEDKIMASYSKVDNSSAVRLNDLYSSQARAMDEILAERKAIYNERGVTEEDYKKSLDSISQYSFLPSIPELESIVEENEYLKVMKKFCDAHKFDISSTRVLGKDEKCSIRKEVDIKYMPTKMDDGSTFYPAGYAVFRIGLDPTAWEGVIINGEIALQVESFVVTEEYKRIETKDKTISYTRKKPLMAFKILDLEKALSDIKRAKKHKRRLEKRLEKRKKNN